MCLLSNIIRNVVKYWIFLKITITKLTQLNIFFQKLKKNYKIELETTKPKSSLYNLYLPLYTFPLNYLLTACVQIIYFNYI